MTRMNWGKVTKNETAKRHQAAYEKQAMEKEKAETKARHEAVKRAMSEIEALKTVSPSQFSLTSQAELVTPEMATKWLEGHVHNRALTHSKAMSYAKDMKDNKWDLNGEALIFDWDGRLQDGQHRLWACVEANTGFWTVITRGIDPATFVTIDTGKSRSVADILSMEKFPNHTTVAAAARIVMGYWHGEPRANHRYPNRDVLQFVKSNTALPDWVAKSRQSPVITSVTSHLAAVAFVGAQTYPEQADLFMRQFKTGESLSVGSPILTIRNRIFTDKGLRSSEKFELIVRAWNAYIENRMLIKAVLASTFPKIRGDLRT